MVPINEIEGSPQTVENVSQMNGTINALTPAISFFGFTNLTNLRSHLLLVALDKTIPPTQAATAQRILRLTIRRVCRLFKNTSKLMTVTAKRQGTSTKAL